MTDGPGVLVADDEDDSRALVAVADRRTGCAVVASVADGGAAYLRAPTSVAGPARDVRVPAAGQPA